MGAETDHVARRGSLGKGALGGVVFATLWGGWAFYINSGAGLLTSLRAAVTQGLFSFAMTFFFSVTVDYLYARADSMAGKIVLAFLVPVGVMLSALVLVHLATGTPNILLTVGPSTSLAAAYCLAKIVRGTSHRSGPGG